MTKTMTKLKESWTAEMTNLLDKVLAKDYEVRNMYRAWRDGVLDEEGRAYLAEELRDYNLGELAARVDGSEE